MISVYLPTLAVCCIVVIAVTEIEARANGEKWRKPESGEARELCEAISGLIIAELRDDVNTARGYEAGTVAWKAIETVVGLAVMIRTFTHLVVYAVGRGGTEWLGDIEPRFELVADPINLKRPFWNEMTARGFCAIIAVTYAQNAPKLVWGYGPAVDALLFAFVVANGIVLLADPLVGVVGRTRNIDNETTNAEMKA